MKITLDEAVKQFFVISEELNDSNDVTGAMVFERILDFYETRIEGAVLANDGDMLLLQWGSSRALMIDKPMDFRIDNGDSQFEDNSRLYLDFTRQVLVEREGEDTDFDSEAIQMSLTLYYGEELEETPLGNMWIETPKVVGQRKSEYLEKELVRSLLNLNAEKITVVAGLCG